MNPNVYPHHPRRQQQQQQSDQANKQIKNSRKKGTQHHRGFGVHVSFVRSVTMDSWSGLQLERMKCGGNSRLREFWKRQHLDGEDLTVEKRYDNEAMEKYRACLLREAKGEEVNEEEIEYIGYKPVQREPSSNKLDDTFFNSNTISSSQNLQRAGNGQESAQDDHGESNNDILEDLSSWASSFASKSSEVASNLATKTKVVASQLGEKAAQASTKVKEQLQEADLGNKITESASHGWASVSSNVSSWWSSAQKSVWNNHFYIYIYIYMYMYIHKGEEGGLESNFIRALTDEKNGDDDLRFYNPDETIARESGKYSGNALSSDTFFDQKNEGETEPGSPNGQDDVHEGANGEPTQDNQQRSPIQQQDFLYETPDINPFAVNAIKEQNPVSTFENKSMLNVSKDNGNDNVAPDLLNWDVQEHNKAPGHEEDDLLGLGFDVGSTVFPNQQHANSNSNGGSMSQGNHTDSNAPPSDDLGLLDLTGLGSSTQQQPSLGAKQNKQESEKTANVNFVDDLLNSHAATPHDDKNDWI
ncbi:hypothetical protein RFI_24419 [Reticulomyxa filosa]|uniref:Arf-GAP domain-containing protein n=1 Tax=Reticulomyxa filosa TaxID=46433 RepID=X6MIS3_RETFI|nr:hypothetical protein RFI_24419 [Reticulomyxa filosa]|eukprot:ETO12955.1 hypothetical protein RFI_24419 [Reticulomyxa filosa]